MSRSGYVQDRVVAVYGEAIHAETVATGRVCERQHIADPLARLTSHVRCSGMYGDCPEIMSLSNGPGPERRPPVAPRRAPASPRSTVAERAWTCRLWPVAEASPLSNAAARKDCTKYSNALVENSTRTRSQSPASLQVPLLVYTLRINSFRAPKNASLFAITTIKNQCLVAPVSYTHLTLPTKRIV